MKFSKSNILYLLRLLCRYYIAYQMFSYAFAKILKSQFDLGLSSTIDESLNSLNGFALTWYYYGFSRTYGLIIACTQIASALLLLFRKTERIGVVLFLSFMVNILLVNYFYEIDGAKSMSIRLTIMGVFLLLTDWKAFKYYFFKTNIKEHFIPEIIPSKIKNFYWIKFLIIPVMIFYSYQYIADIKKVFLVKNELFGVWEIFPRNTKTKIDKLYIDYDNRIKIRDTLDNQYYGAIALDLENKKLDFKVDHYSDRAYYFIKDSLDKLDVEEKDIKEVRSKIREFYNTKNNTLPINLNYSYSLKGDTLILNGETQLRYLNITDNYKN
ncbi:hypothetical protein [Leeuwenhoekiella palythoae]|uniref:hypothetical protein n=1 Tax=Leeuwenhoekiella palythoae TaxID=573501 RepID=UPI00351827EA